MQSWVEDQLIIGGIYAHIGCMIHSHWCILCVITTLLWLAIALADFVKAGASAGTSLLRVGERGVLDIDQRRTICDEGCLGISLQYGTTESAGLLFDDGRTIEEFWCKWRAYRLWIRFHSDYLSLVSQWNSGSWLLSFSRVGQCQYFEWMVDLIQTQAYSGQSFPIL